MNFKSLLPAAVAALSLAAAAGSARAAFTVTYQQVGIDVVATGSGSLSAAGLALAATTPQGSFVEGGAGIEFTGPVTPQTVQVLTGVQGEGVFGTGSTIDATSGSGDEVGISNFGFLSVQLGYTFGTPLTSSATWSDQTLTSLGLTPGTYTATWGTGPTADSLTVVVSSVPEPAAIALLALPVVALSRRRSRARLA